MLKRFAKNCKVLPRGSGGSAIIVVLVAMAFISILVIVLLSLSVTNIQMKKMDKGSKANFYSAESAMNEIRAGVQAVVSDTIKEAYTSELLNYYSLSQLSKDDQIKHFAGVFYTDFYQSTIGSQHLFAPTKTTFDLNLLKSFISDSHVTVTSPQTVHETSDSEGNTTGITLQGIVVKYIANGYQTTVSSDIVVTAPTVVFNSSKSVQTSAPNFAIIAKDIIQQPAGAGTVSIGGNVYAGGLTVGGNGDSFSAVNSESFVLAGPLNVLGGAVNFNASSSLWAKDIILDLAGSASLSGDAYIANDLNLKSAGTKAILSGRYFGYGTSTTDPNASSAILINGRDTLLDMSALRTLLLAGRGSVAYTVDPNNPQLNQYVMTGESISVKPNQLAYLVPDTCLVDDPTNQAVHVSNPFDCSANNMNPDNTWLQNRVNVNKVFMNNKTLTQYGITSTADNVQYIRKSAGSTNLIYICLKFTDKTIGGKAYTAAELASAYFKDYYSAYKPTVQKYLNLYSDGIFLQSTATKNLVADAYTFDGNNLGDIIDPNLSIPDPNQLPVNIKTIRDAYANLCVTLSRLDAGTGATNAYDYYVDSTSTSQFNKIPASQPQFYPAADTPKVAVIKGDYTIDASTKSSIHLVIATGNVSVNNCDFHGLIFAGGTVTLNKASVTADGALVQDALQALQTLSTDANGNQVYVYYYLNPLHISPLTSSLNSNGASGWDLGTLVTYQNWAKNEAS